MSRYPQEFCDFDQLVSLSFRYWFKCLLQIFFIIVVFVGVLSIMYHLPPVHRVVETIAIIISSAVAFFLFSMALYRADTMLKDQPVSLIDAAKVTIMRILKVWAAILVLCITLVLISFLVKWVIFSLFRLEGVTAALGITFIGGLPVMVGLIFFYFTVPIIAVDNESLWRAFYRSADLTQQKWLHVFGLYTGGVILFMALMPYSRHAHWLKDHYLSEVFNWLVLCLIMPLLVNLTLFILRNFQIREDKVSDQNLQSP